MDKALSSSKHTAFLLSVMAIAITMLNIWCLNKGLMLREEGWFHYLVKDFPDFASSSNYYFYVKNLFNGKILINRITGFSIGILTAAVFACGLFNYFEKKANLNKYDLISLSALSILSLSLTNIIVCNVLAYTTMNREMVLLSMALLLFALSTKNKITETALVFLSGLFAGSLFFIMITNMLMPLSVIIFLHFQKGHKKDAIWYALGIIASIICFFGLFYPYPIDHFIEGIVSNVDKTVNNKFVSQHGIFAMIIWCINAARFFGLQVLPLLLLYYAIPRIKSLAKPAKWSVLILLMLGIGFYLYDYIVKPSGKVETMAPFVALYVIGLIEMIEEKRNIWTLLLIFSFLITLSLGSDTDISRKTNLIIFILPTAFIAIKSISPDKSGSLMGTTLALLAIYSALYFTLPFRNNWAGIVYSRQTLPIKELGINENIKIEPTTYNEIKELQSAGLNEKQVVLSSFYSWSYCYVLDCKPVFYGFNLYEDEALANINKLSSLSNLVLVEDKTDPPFSQHFFKALEEHPSYQGYEIKKTNWHNLYFLK